MASQINKPMEYNPFGWVLPMQHMCKVRIVQLLWRKNSFGRQEVKNSYANDRFCSLRDFPRELMITHLGRYIDRLPLPKALKIELMFFVIIMIETALDWLQAITGDLKEGNQRNENHADIFSHFIDNFSWDNNGCVDGRTMVKSYVRHKETIDFPTWRLLCAYCIEDDIRSFAVTADWRHRRALTNSAPHCIYWYWKIFRQFPTRGMFTSQDEYIEFVEFYYTRRPYDGNFVEKMLLWSATSWVFPAAVSATKYLRNELNNEVRFKQLFSDNNIDYLSPTTIPYLSGKMGYEALIKHIPIEKFFPSLVLWPWILFTHNWTKMLEGERFLSEHFVKFLDSILSNTIIGTQQLEKQYDELLEDRMLYLPFEKLWIIFNRRFGRDDGSACEIFWKVYDRKDIRLCKILFESVRRGRRFFLSRILENQVRRWANTLLSDDDDIFIYYSRFRKDRFQRWANTSLSDDHFCSQILEEVLHSDTERKIFKNIIHLRRRDN